MPNIPVQYIDDIYDTRDRLVELLKEWIEDKTEGPFFHEDEHGEDSLLNRTRHELYLSN